MAFAHAQNPTFRDCSFVDIGGDSNIYNINGSEPGLSDLLKVISPGAAYDSQEREPPARCHPGTRTEVLEKMMNWVDSQESGATTGRVLWLHGPAGAGKSAIAQTFCERCAEQGHLAASFFFSRGAPRRDTGAHLFTTIAFHLTRSIPGHWPQLRNAIKNDPLAIHSSTSIQIQKLIIETLQATVLKSHSSGTRTSKPPSLVVIDGLDECAGNDAQRRILAHILDIVRNDSISLRFIIVSRPELHIQHSLEGADFRDFTFPISLYGDHKSLQDVRTYLTSEFERIYSSELHAATFAAIPRPFPSEQDLEVLVDRSDGYFVYASTIVRYVDDENSSPVLQLEAVRNASHCDPTSGPFEELDRLYRQILSACPSRNIDHVKRVLGFILGPAIGGAPLKLVSLIQETLHIRPDELSIALRPLHSILRHDLDSGTILPFHASLAEFIFDPARAGRFYIDPKDNLAMIIRAFWDCLKTWYRSQTSNRAGRILNILTYLRQGDALRDDVIREMITTDIYFWDFLFSGSYPRLDERDAELTSWLGNTIAEYEALQSPPLALIRHFAALRQTIRKYAATSNAAFENEVIQNRLLSIQDHFNISVPFVSSECSLSNEYQKRDGVIHDHTQARHVGCEIQMVHTRLAVQCMDVLSVSQAEMHIPHSTVITRTEAYNYSRIFWAAHISRARPGLVDLLHRLRHFRPDKFQDTDNFRATKTSIENDLRGQQTLTEELGYWASGTPDVFEADGLCDLEDMFESGLSKRQCQISDWVNAELILEWLKKMPDPPADHVSRWERLRDERREALDCKNDAYTFANRGGDMQMLRRKLNGLKVYGEPQRDCCSRWRGLALPSSVFRSVARILPFLVILLACRYSSLS